MNRIEIELQLRKVTRQVTSYQVSIVEYLLKKPGSNNLLLSSKLGIPYDSVKTSVRRLKTVGVLTESRHVNLTPMESLRKFRLPQHILNGTLPPKEWKFVHIAARLTELDNDDEIPELKMTKSQFLQNHKELVEKNTEFMQKKIYTMQNDIAQFCLYYNDLEAFKDMQGTITLPERLD